MFQISSYLLAKDLYKVFFFLCNLIIVYIFLIPSVGTDIRLICLKKWNCNRLINISNTFGYEIDLSDHQWKSFRSSIFLMSFSFLLMTILLKIFSRFHLSYFTKNRISFNSYFHFCSGVVFLIFLHRNHLLIIFIISSLGFMIAKYFLTTNYHFIFLWIYVILVLLLKELHRYRQQSQIISLLFDQRYGGFYRWQLPINFIILRIISFAMDFYWAKRFYKSQSILQVNQHFEPISLNGSTPAAATTPPSHLVRTVNHRELSEYNYINFLSYIVFSPLYMAGPIVTFNAYISYCDQPCWTENTLLYGLRWCVSYLLLEGMLHYFPFFAVVQSGLVLQLSPSQQLVVLYTLLKMMWLKFLLIWRFFRLWSLCLGVPAPENMLRCLSDNYSISQFWRGWHSSYNLWIVRPLGGNKNPFRNIIVVFFFVALWHDTDWRLLAWAALNSIFYGFEFIGKKIFHSVSFQSLPSVLSTMICTIAAASNIMILITVNLVGYAVGISGMKDIAERVFSWDGVTALAGAFYILCVGYQIMLFINYYKTRMKSV